MHRNPKQRGFTLIELIITVAIISIIAAFAVPAYNGYIHTARMTEGADSLAALRLAQLEYFEENGFFFIGPTTADVIDNNNGRWTPLPWDITATQAVNIAALNFTYVVTNCPSVGGGAAGALDAAGNPTQCFQAVATGANQLRVTDIITVTN